MSSDNPSDFPEVQLPPGSPKTHPAADLCSSADHDTSCFSLMGWSDPQRVEKWLGIPNVFSVECSSLGANISGSITREMKVVTKEGPEGTETTLNLVRKIGVHDKGLGRCREAVFYLQFAPPDSSTDTNFIERGKNSPLRALRQYIPKCYFSHFDNTSETKEKMAIVIERIDGVDAGYFFGRHSPLNWKFKAQDELDKLLAPWAERGINEKHICIIAAKIAAQIHGPFWNKVNEQLLHDPSLEHAARRDLYQIVFDQNREGADESCETGAPSFWKEAIAKSRNVWEAEKLRIAENGVVSPLDGTGSSDNMSPSTPAAGSPSYNNAASPSTSVDSIAGSPAMPSFEPKRPFGFSQLVAECVERSFAKTTWKNALAELRSLPVTFVHGDFHPANMIVQRPVATSVDGDGKETVSSASPVSAEEREKCAKIFLVDYEMFGFGSGPQELGQYMISHCRPERRRNIEEEVVNNYIRHLREDFGVAKTDEEEKFIREEYVRGGVGRWLWFLPLLMSMGTDPNFRKYFHDQVYYFMLDHGITPENVPLVRV